MPARNFEDYIIEAEHKPITLDDYAKSPATAFLRYIVGAKAQRMLLTNAC